MTPFMIQYALQQALQHHQAGRLQEAEQLYRQILAQQPEHPDALHFLGVLANQSGDGPAAVDLIRKAILRKSNYPQAYNNLGNALKNMGRLDEAVAAYRQALALHPRYPEAHNNLAVALRAQGQCDEAIAACRKAIALKPNYSEAHNNLGNSLKDRGRLDEAIAAYQQAAAIKPNDPVIHSNLGKAFIDAARPGEALAACRQALALNPNDPEALNNFGSALKINGQLSEAITAYRQALELKPGFADALINLAHTLKTDNQLDAAIPLYRQALALKPNDPEAHYNLGNALTENGQPDEALPVLRQAVALKSDYPEAHSTLAIALRAKGQLDEALAALHQAIALKPDFAAAHVNLGGILKDLGRLDEAIAACRHALTLDAGLSEAHFNLGFMLLAQGDLLQGWEEYEWRWQRNDIAFPRRTFPQEKWDGSPLQGRTILLHAEQGFGDTIQFARYATLVAHRGGRVLLACQKQLIPLLKQLEGVAEVLDYADPPPEFDVHCPLLSLPQARATTLETIPASVPYLSANPESIAHWRQELEKIPGLKIGITWQGNPKNAADAKRSISLAHFEPLAKVPGITLISLQKGTGAEQIPAVAEKFSVLDLGDRLDGPGRPFMDSPALMKNLDLVITSDTVTCHLAGALAVPVWTLLPFAPDWRWLLHRADSPWYPTMRLFRQPAIGNWAAVMQQVTHALAQWPR